MELICAAPRATRALRPLLENGEHAALRVVERGRVLASALTGIDRRAVRLSGQMRGHFTEFWAEDRPDAVQLLFQGMAQWQRERGMRMVFGPVAPDGGGFQMGVQVHGFGLPEEPLNPTNPAYYDALIRGAGLEVETQWLSFGLNMDALARGRYVDAARWAEGRGVRVRAIDPLRSRGDCAQLYAAMELQDRIDMQEFAARLARLGPHLDRRLVLIAERHGEPVGMLMALRDPSSGAVRIATAHVRADHRRTPALVALVGGMVLALESVRPAQLTASVVDSANAASLALIRGAGGLHLRTFCQYSLKAEFFH